MSVPKPARRFISNPWQNAGFVVLFAVLAASAVEPAIASWKAGNIVTAAVVVAICVFLSVTSMMQGVTLTPDGMRVRRLLTSQLVEWPDVEGFTQVRSRGNPAMTHVIAVKLTSGAVLRTAGLAVAYRSDTYGARLLADLEAAQQEMSTPVRVT